MGKWYAEDLIDRVIEKQLGGSGVDLEAEVLKTIDLKRTLEFYTGSEMNYIEIEEPKDIEPEEFVEDQEPIPDNVRKCTDCEKRPTCKWLCKYAWAFINQDGVWLREVNADRWLDNAQESDRGTWRDLICSTMVSKNRLRLKPMHEDIIRMNFSEGMRHEDIAKEINRLYPKVNGEFTARKVRSTIGHIKEKIIREYNDGTIDF